MDNNNEIKSSHFGSHFDDRTANQDFAQNLSKRRKALGYTQGDLAQKTGIGLKTIQNYESGDLPKGDYLVLLAKELKCTVGWLFDGDGPEPEPTNGPLYNKDKGPDSLRVAAPEPEYDSHGAREPHKLSRPDHELIGRVYELLRSPSNFRDSIISAIHTIYDASIIKRRLNKIEREVAEFKTICSVLADRTERRCGGKDEKIRDCDPPEKKEDLLKLRKSTSY